MLANRRFLDAKIRVLLQHVAVEPILFRIVVCDTSDALSVELVRRIMISRRFAPQKKKRTGKNKLFITVDQHISHRYSQLLTQG